MNLNELSTEVTKREGGNQNLSIAQVKEVIRAICDILAERNICECLALLWKMRSNGQKRLNP